MKIALLLAVWTWLSSSGNGAAQLRFTTEESLDEIQEDEIHKLTPVQLEMSPGVPLRTDRAATWSQTFYQLLISCDHGTLQLDREVEQSLVDTTFLCANDSLQSRAIGAITTAQEVQHILSSIIYQPDLNYHSTWFGVTDPLCLTRNDGNEIVRMEISPAYGGTSQLSLDTCVAVDLSDNSLSLSDVVSTHEKKISVTSVNDPPTIEREPGPDLSVQAGGACIKLSGFTLDDAEATALESVPRALIPILTLQLNVKTGTLRVNRRSALQNGIHAIKNGKNMGDSELAWTLPDLFDSPLTLKGALSDLNEFLPEVEYCSSPGDSMLVSDALLVILSDNGFCGDLGKESLSASLVVPVHILPTANLGKLLMLKTSIVLTNHSASVPLRYTSGRIDEVECTLELKYSDGMLIGLDYQTGTLYKKTNMASPHASRTLSNVLVPTNGLIVRFWGDKNNRESANFKLARRVCSVGEMCHQLESNLLYEDSSDEDVIEATQALTLDNESVSELQIIRYPVSRFWLIWNIPLTFSQEVVAAPRYPVSVQTVGRCFRLQGKSDRIEAQLKTLTLYSLIGGVGSNNRLNVTISTLNDNVVRSQDVLSAQVDVFPSPVLENIQLLHPRELVLGESSEMSLESTAISYPSTYDTNAALRWIVRSTIGSIWWDSRSISPAIVSRQISKNELELRGSFVDLNAALPNIRIDESAIQDSAFTNVYEDQTFELLAVPLTKTNSVQTLTTSSTEGSIVGSFVLGLDLPVRIYPDLELDIASGHCKSSSIGANDNVGTISQKITQMTCDVVSAKPSDKVFRREIQSIRVFALYPSQVDELTGTFRVSFRGQTSNLISLQSSTETIKAAIIAVVVDANGIEVSRNELPEENGFEWRVTFGTEGDVGEVFKVVYAETSVSFKMLTTVKRKGRRAADLRFDTFYPDISLSAQWIKSASSESIALELSFSSTFEDIPALSAESSTLAPAQTAQLLDVVVKNSKSSVIAGATDLYRLQVQNHVTLPLASCSNASILENAIRGLPIEKLRVSVRRKASAFVQGRFDYTIVMSAPSLLSLTLIADGATPLSKALFRSSIVNRGSETLIAFDTILMVLETLDKPTLLSSGEINAQVSRMKKKLGIQLPVAYLQVDLNQTLTIAGIDFEGYSHKLNFTVSCAKGQLYLQKQTTLPRHAEPADSTLKISGYFSTLKEVLRQSHFVYSPHANATGYDKLVFAIESLDDRAVEMLPVVIHSRVKLPSLTLPVSPMSVFENEYVSITGVTLNLADTKNSSPMLRGITVQITTRSGVVGIRTSGFNHDLQHNSTIQIQGDAENVNAALKRLSYRPVAVTPSEDQIRFSVFWTAENGEENSHVTFGTIPIKIIARPLAINVLKDGKAVGDRSLVTTTMNASASLGDLLIQVNGGDGHRESCNTLGGQLSNLCNVTLDLSLFAGHGLISSSSETFLQDRAQDSPLGLVRFIGSVGEANRFLQQQDYVPDAKFYGPDQIVINIKHITSVTDEEWMDEDAVLLPVFVSLACEAPQLIWADSGTNFMSLSMPTSSPFTLPEILIIQEGLETGYCQDDKLFHVIVESDQVSPMATSTVVTRTLDDPRALVLKGLIWDLNLALRSVKYKFEIHRKTQIPLTASVKVHVEGGTTQENNLRSSAVLQLKFIGNTRLLHMLVRDTIVGFEDTEIPIGDEINLDGFADLTGDGIIIISVHNGAVYAAADSVNIEASAKQRVNTSDKSYLRSVMSNLRYISNPNFNGIDEIHFKTQTHESVLYIYIQAENDPPEFTFNSGELKDWYKYPRTFIPTFQLKDPDDDQTFQVDIHEENGSLSLDQISSRSFDGVTVEFSSLSSSLRMTSSLSRLNTILLQRLIEVIPHNCVKDDSMRVNCGVSIEICIDDGSDSVCQELRLPQQELFYRVTVPDWAKSLNVSMGSSLNLSNAFEVRQRSDAMSDLLLRVHVSSGSVRIDVPTCAELRDVVDANQQQRSALTGVSQTIYARDIACLNEALATLQLQSAYNENNSLIVQLELFSDDMKVLADGSIIVKVTDKILPWRIISVRATHDKPWVVTIGKYAKLSSLVNISIVADPVGTFRNESNENVLQLNVSCSMCEWKYQEFVPRVSYEFAQIPNSKLTFIGLMGSMNEVLKTLELMLAINSDSGTETVHFQLSPVSHMVRGMEPLWSESTNISIPFTTKYSSLLWDAQQTLFILQSPDYSADLSGVKLTGMEENPSRNLTIRLDCTHGNAIVSMPKVTSLFLELPCGSDEPAINFTTARSSVDNFISSTIIKVIPNARDRRMELQLTAVDSISGGFGDETSIKLQYRSLLQSPVTSMEPHNASLTIQVNKEKVQSTGDLVAVDGDLDDPTWYRMRVRVAHGRLSIPTTVCCVDIRETKTENELDIVGSALALKQALAAVQFQVNQNFWGKASLEVTIALFSPSPLWPNVTFLNFFAKTPVLVSTSLQSSQKRPDNPTRNAVADVEESWSISGIYIGDDGENLDMEIGTGNELFFRTMWDEFQLDKDHIYTFTPADTAVDKLHRWNVALETLQYHQQNTTVIQVRNPLAPVSHQQESDSHYDVPVPIVTTGANLYYSSEDSAFQFPDLALQFPKSKPIYSAQDDQLPSAVLTYRPTKYVNPRNDDDDRRIYQLEIRVSYGSISMIRPDTLNGDDQKTRQSRLKLEDNVMNLERDLNRLIYFPPQNWNEEQFPGGHIVEWQFVVSFESKSVESFADLVILSKIDAPVISVPHALEDSSHYMNDYLSVLRLECLPLVCDEDTPMVLDGFSVRSADTTKQQKATTDLLVISISVYHGIISLGDTWRTNCINGFMGAQSWKRISFKANVNCVNRVLPGMVYIGEPNFSGTDLLNIRVEHASELDKAFDEVIVPVIVIELNDAPYITVDSIFYEADEDIPLVIDDLRLRDPDALDESLRVILETNYGQLALLRPNGVKLTTELVQNASSSRSRLTLEGTLRNLDAAIASVVYTSAKDWNSLQLRSDDGMNGFDTISITSTDLSSFNGSSVSLLFVYVEPRPDPVLIGTPSNGLSSIYANDEPGTLRGDEDTWINVRGLAFFSADATSRATLVVSLLVTRGILSLGNSRGLTFLEGTMDGGRSLKLKGTFANVNECTIALRYLPSKDFYGQDLLVVTATAVDEYTQQQTPLSSIRVDIVVDAVNDAPVWNTGSSIVREIQQDQAASIGGISFHDVDVDAVDCTVEICVMDLIVETSGGFVVLPNQSSPLFSNDMTTKQVTYTVLSGTPDDLNMLLSEMTFMLADPEYYRADNPSSTDIKLQLTVDDRGISGSGGPQISSTTIVFSPVKWSSYELSLLVPEDLLTLNEDTAYSFEGKLQLVDPDSAQSFRNLFELSINCTHGVFALGSAVTGVQVLQNDSDDEVVLRGFFAQLNAALNGSSYIPAPNWYGSEEISLSVIELSHLEKPKKTVVASIFLFVAPVCDEPHWSALAETPLTMQEDGYLLIDTLSLTNPDLDDKQREVEVTISVAHGGVMLSMTKGLLVQEAVYSISEDRLVAQHITVGHLFSESSHFFKDLAVRGRVSDINVALNGMVFKPWLDYNSDGWPVDEIVLTATSFCGNSTTSHVTIPIAIFAVNDPPVLISQHFQPVESPYSFGSLEAMSWRSSIEAKKDSSLQLESTELYNPDGSGELRLLVNVSCFHCSITSEYLSHPSETQPSDDLIVVTRNPKNDEGVQLMVHGTLVSLNSGLMRQLFFRGADNFIGLAFVLVEISDFGNYGEEGALRSVFVLCVRVNP
ncbi:hypothetical protein F441_11245 [Phytophthora nicotianae CJ01A1]|uniref:PDZ domain-containing protein n=2 Tax=Phytophthora nicotianae TaxID=4792 RepID=W2WSZ7_PHYNI|nr:hypothetical protein F441_11245 [Phytophthora nicotianae CJ01A1]